MAENETDLPPVAEDAGNLLETYLRERDCACPACGYNLRNLRSTRCPECATEIELAIRLTEPRQGLLLTGLIGLAAGVGFSGLLLVFGAVMTLKHGSGGPATFFKVVGLGTLIQGAAVWVWLRAWKRLRLRPLGTRFALAIVCWLLTLANLVVFILNVR